MTLTIDSAPVDLPPLPGEPFKAYFNRIANHLLKSSRCIGNSQLDGQQVLDMTDGDRLFSSASTLSIESVTLQEALQANIALQCNAVRKLEDDCENLITDALLSDPRLVANAWSALCEELKGILSFLPVLNGLLTDRQLDALIDERLANLNAIMMEVSGVLSKADVVAFSDLLELKLMPWLAGLREFLQAQLTMVDSLSKNAPAS